MYKYFFLLLIIFTTHSFACKCYSSTENIVFDLEKHILDSENIYEGILISSKIINWEVLKSFETFKSTPYKNWPYIEGTVYVKSVIKGKTNRIEKIYTDLTDCGLPIIIGSSYIIFSKKEEKRISICGASKVSNPYKQKKYIQEIKKYLKK